MPSPGGYSGTAAVALVRALTNMATAPVDATIYTFLNTALEQVNNELELSSKTQSTAVVGGAVTFQLPTDVLDFDAITFSTGLPTAPGVIEYEMVELGPEQFIEATWNAPTMGGGPTVLYRRIQDAGNQITIQLYPTAPASGYVNVYYRSRGTLWDSANPTTVPDLDSAYQYLAILFACQMTCGSKENTRRANYFAGQAQNELERARTKVGRRRRQRRSQVRDVLSSPSVTPAWWPQ